MSSAQFDPCRQWLGIDAVDLADPRRVLGILPAESDPLVVRRAADARLTHLKGIAPGPFEMARTALIKRVEEAREAVLAQIAATPTPAAPIGRSFTMPLPPGGSIPRAPAPAFDRPGLPSFPPSAPPAIPAAGRIPNIPVVPAVPLSPVPFPQSAAEASPWNAPDAADQGGFVTVKTRPVYRKQSSASGILLLLLVGLAAAGGGLFWMNVRGKERRKEGHRDVAVVKREDAGHKDSEDDSHRQSSGTKGTAGMRRPPRDPNDTTSDRAVSTSAPPEQKSQPAQRRPEPKPALKPKPAPKPEPAPKPKPAPQPAGSSSAAEPASTDRTDSPAPAAAEPAIPDEDSAAAINLLLTEVLVALQKQQFDAAELAVKAADKKTGGGPAEKRVRSWDSLVTYAKGFADYRSQALATVKPGQEYDIDGKKVGIIEIDADKFIYRHAGKSTTVPGDRIPGGILMAIITEWFDDNPANNLYLGAYHATKGEPDLEKARSCWQLAGARGADASDLLPLLKDPVLVKAAADAGGQ